MLWVARKGLKNSQKHLDPLEKDKAQLKELCRTCCLKAMSNIENKATDQLTAELPSTEAIQAN